MSAVVSIVLWAAVALIISAMLVGIAVVVILLPSLGAPSNAAPLVMAGARPGVAAKRSRNRRTNDAI
jgi:hypothetical protein